MFCYHTLVVVAPAFTTIFHSGLFIGTHHKLFSAWWNSAGTAERWPVQWWDSASCSASSPSSLSVRSASSARDGQEPRNGAKKKKDKKSLRLKHKSVVQQRPTDEVDTRLVANKQTQTRDSTKTTPAKSTGASLYFQDKTLEVMSAGSPSSAAFMGCRNSRLLMCDFNNNTATTTILCNKSFFRDTVNIFWYQVIVFESFPFV